MKKNLAHFLDTIDSKRMVKALSWVVAGAGTCLVGAYFAYFLRFQSGFSEKQDVWGQFGDFIGGTVNPILSFLSLLALVFTVVLQTRQLENSREELADSKTELEATREEMKRSAESQAAMAAAANAQAKYANISAQLSALQAALSVASEMLSQAQQAGVVAGPPEHHQTLLLRKKKIAGEILRITDTLLKEA
jgi:uncharacterized membrane protein